MLRLLVVIAALCPSAMVADVASSAAVAGDEATCGDVGGACSEESVEAAEEITAARSRMELLQVGSGRRVGIYQHHDIAGTQRADGEEADARDNITAAATGVAASEPKDDKSLAQTAAEVATNATAEEEAAASDFCVGTRRQGFFCFGGSRVHCCMRGLVFYSCGTQRCLHGCRGNLCITTYR